MLGRKGFFIREENFSGTFSCPRKFLLLCFIGPDYITWPPSYKGASWRSRGDSGCRVSKASLLREARTRYLSLIKISAFEWRLFVPTLDHFFAYVLLYKLRVKLFSSLTTIAIFILHWLLNLHFFIKVRKEAKNFCGIRGWGDYLWKASIVFILYERLCCRLLFHCGTVCPSCRSCDMMWWFTYVFSLVRFLDVV